MDLWELPRYRFTDSQSHAEEIIDRLFPGSPLLCIGKSNSQFSTQHRESWRGRLAEMALIVPSPMNARTGHTQDGKKASTRLKTPGRVGSW